MTDVVQTQSLTKSYGAVQALGGLDLIIPRGGVYGVLGPNGAGKSTLFRILLGLIRPSSGTATLLGGSALDRPTLRRTGSMIETPRFPPYLTARQVLHWLDRAHGGGRAADIPGWLERVGLSDAADRRVRGFSVGMMQRLGVAAALLHRPEVVILDEPTSGMDPPGIQDMRALIRRLADEDGVTVILASHQLAEVQRVCDRVAILNKGRLVREGAVSELTSLGERLRLLVDRPEAALGVLGAKGAGEDGAVLAAIGRDEAPALIRALVENGVGVIEARWVGTDLESIFFSETQAETTHAAD
ncbi:ABC transporter ATP-binding protein [Brevundimonas sp. 2R-24]|uniref:ABC transporter ATP-binding protein n=1 Tax=Peiella sedimenti TaxID=3061083 RepID=A0ABT8SPG4_9CAUL|nr:ABC transporter ATP-binding protein [Caulobacteraceae bacterium XZ-24]